jgi:hypothetical protein
MAANPFIVSKTITVTYDHVTTTIKAGTVIDVPAGSALLTAIGAGNLTALTPQQTSGAPGVGPEVDTQHMGGGQF